MKEGACHDKEKRSGLQRHIAESQHPAAALHPRMQRHPHFWNAHQIHCIYNRRIKNINADAIIAVYPFTPQPAISQAVIGISDVPVFVGVGGGITGGDRAVRLAIEAENQGAFGVVVNAPISNEVISRIKEVVDIPVIATIVSDQMDIRSRIEAGADFLNVSGAAATPQIVRRIRAQFPNIPILATGGPNDETILETIHAGANAITYSPPSNGELFAAIMQKYREKL